MAHDLDSLVCTSVNISKLGLHQYKQNITGLSTTQLQGKETLYDLQCSESSGLNASRGAVKWNTSERICHTCFDGGTRSHISLTLSQF